ncbi:hypothetical protein JOB18_025013 [Solea senegalensis]|uniref:Uncharacterized protein n=1 Tax=Solea senegalensis TaxID=28829 RepID=A0AAV6R225_SOLSE|nr:hypothetical protein JOB18_025013 [Solea senegalensis]
MDASGAPVTDELTGVHHSPQRDAIYEPEKTARRRSTLLHHHHHHHHHRCLHRPPQCSTTSRTVHPHSFNQRPATQSKCR